MTNYQPTPPPSGYGAPVQKTNTLAIVGLVLAILVPLVGLILSYVARGQIRRTGEQGEGIAKAGIIVGWILTILGVVVIVVNIVLAVALVNSGAYNQ